MSAAASSWRERATITVEEAAPILGIGRSSAYEAARTGDIPTLRVGRRLLVPVAAFRRMLGEIDRQNESAPAAATPGPSKASDGHAHAELYG